MDKSRLRWVALTVAAAMFLHNLDSTLITTSLPQIGVSFGMRALDLSAAISAYVLASAALLPLSAWLADRYGARDVFVLAIVLFTLSSAGCALSQSYGWFLAARILQGAAGALMVPVGRTVVLEHYQGRDLLEAIALITWPALLAPVIAPVLGGLITTYSTWRWNFLLNLPLGVAAVVAALRLMPATRGPERKPLDVPGMLYLAGGLSGLLYAMDRFTSPEATHGPTLTALLLGGAALLLGLRHLQRTPEPLLELSSYSVPTYRLTNGTVSMVFRATISATPFMLPLLLQLGYGLNALQAGSYVMAYFLGNVAMKPGTSPLLRAFGFRSVLVVNGVISGLATAACGFIDPLHARTLALAVLFITGLARSMQFTALNTLGFADLEARQRSSGSTMHSIMVSVATALGIAASAILLQRSAGLHGSTQAGIADFSLVFVLVGLAGLISGLCYLLLQPDAGAEVSGHRLVR